MENVKLIDFTDLNLEEKKMVLEWRNHLDIRKWMYNQDMITLSEHLEFIKSLKSTQERLYFLVKIADEYIGVIDFTKIVPKKSLHMGIYANPHTKGYGEVLLNKIIDYSFNNLKVEKIFSEVFKENKKALRLYEKYDFQVIDKMVINDKKVILMELTKDVVK